MEATAGAAPIGAGTGSGQAGSPSSSTKASNSTGSPSQPSRQSGAASPSSTVNEPSSREREPRDQAPSEGKTKQAAPAADDDPELDFGERGKVKRSRVLSDFERMRQSQASEAKRASEALKRAEAAEAYANHLKSQGIDVEAFAKDPQGAMQRWMHDQVRRRIEEAQLDPQEREFRRRDEELKTREQQFAEQEKQRQEQEHAAQVEARRDEFAQHMRKALEGSTLPRNPRTIARMAELIIAAERSGKRFPLSELTQRVSESIANDQAFHASTMAEDPKATAQWIKPYLAHFKDDVSAFAEAAGPELMERLRKHILQAHDAKFNGQKPNQPPQARPRTPKFIQSDTHPNGYVTYDEMIAKAKRRGI